jgi:HAD superfamily hydrolase (TIGR01509 family)
MPIQALIFDFDGLILDTEIPEYQAWQEIYQAHGVDLALETWLDLILAKDRVALSRIPCEYLEAQVEIPLDHAAIRQQQRTRADELLTQQTVMPGVMDTIQAARNQGLKLAVASSSGQEWVLGHLTRLELTPFFDTIQYAELVQHSKPAPDLYCAALAALAIPAGEAIAFEDSPQGVRAANRAGIYCVAVPNRVTEILDFSHADWRLNSLADMPLDALLYQHATLNKGHKE